MRLLPGTKKFGFRTIVLTQAQQRSRLFVCLFRMPSFSAPAPPNRFRYPGARLFRPVRFFECLPALRLRSTASACFPARGSGLPPAPPPSSAPAPVCSVRFAFPEASRPCGPDRPQAPFSGPRIVPSACTPEPLSVSRHPSAPSGTGRTRKAPTLREECRGIRRSGRSAHPCGPWHGYSAPRIVPPACTATLFGPGTPEPLPVSRHPSALSDSLFRKPPGPAAPIDRKRLFPAHGSCLPPAPPNRFRYPGTRLLRPEQDGRERLRPSGRSAAASGGPAGRPTPAGRGTAIPPRRSQTGRFPSTAAPASRRTTPGSGTDVAYRCV